MLKCKLSAGLFLLTTLMLSAPLLTGCASKPLVIQESSLVVRIHKGEPAPTDGYLLSERALSDLMECCELRKE